MEATITTILTGGFTLAGIWYQNYLQERKKFKPSKRTQSGRTEVENVSINFRRIGFTCLIVILPLLLLFLFGKGFIGGDRNLDQYYFIWMLLTQVAIIFGWKKKTRFEKIILVASMLFLAFMVLECMYEARGHQWI